MKTEIRGVQTEVTFDQTTGHTRAILVLQMHGLEISSSALQTGQGSGIYPRWVWDSLIQRSPFFGWSDQRHGLQPGRDSKKSSWKISGVGLSEVRGQVQY